MGIRRWSNECLHDLVFLLGRPLDLARRSVYGVVLRPRSILYAVLTIYEVMTKYMYMLQTSHVYHFELLFLSPQNNGLI